MLNNLNEEKNEFLKISRSINQKNELHLNDINYLKKEIESLNKKTEEEYNLLKEENNNNNDIIKEINEQQNINKDLIVE